MSAARRKRKQVGASGEMKDLLRKPRPLTWRDLNISAWEPRRDCPPIYYEDWVRLAGEHPNQDQVWKSHEYHGRLNEAEKRKFEEIYDMGGES